MFTFLQKKRRAGLLLATALLVVSALGGTALASSALNSVSGYTPSTILLSTLPATSCSLDINNVRVCDLWAKTGTITVPGANNQPQTVNIWGYSDTQSGPATLPGPTLIVKQGESVRIVLHNNLSQKTALNIPGLGLAPDTAGAATGGGTKTYNFTPGAPGTYLYEAGLIKNTAGAYTDDGPRQVAMGLFGTLVVRPSANATQIYDSSSTFNDEAVLVFSELDPALNANPTGFSMRNYSPKYWLVNGKAYPNSAEISTAAGNKVALRYLNAGLMDHSIGSLGLGKMTVMGIDGRKLDNPYSMTAETVTSGQTMDVLTTIPANAPQNARFALYNGARHLDNNGQSNADHTLKFGGMLTFLKVTSGSSGGDTVGPVASNLTVNPAISKGDTALSLTATVSDATTGNANVTSASYVIDNTAATPSLMSGTFTSPTVNVSATIPVTALSGLSTGLHTIYVQGKDTLNNAGAFASITFTIDKDGPVTTGTVAPASNNGSQDVVLSGTGDDSGKGGSDVTSVDYRLDNGATQNVAVSNPSPTAAFTITIPQATVNGLAEGTHTLSVQSKDALGNIGAAASFTFKVDKTKPTVSTLTLTPNPNNGTLVVDVNNLGVRLTATATDPLSGTVQSNIVAAELFIDTVKPDGQGLPLQPVDGNFSSSTENLYSLILLTDGIQNLPQGAHVLYVHAIDAAGNWGNNATINLNIDKTAPSVSGAAITPAATGGAASATLTATTTDPVNTSSTVNIANAPASNIAAAEWFEGTDPGQGQGNAMTVVTNAPTSNLTATINAAGLTLGNHTLQLRAKDAAGNWSGLVSVTLNVQPLFADSFEAGNANAWSARTGNPVVNTASRLAGSFGMQANANATTYVTDNTPANETQYRARFYFNPRGASTGSTANNNAQSIFVGYNSASAAIFRVQYRRNGTTPQVRAVLVLNNNSTVATNWYNLNTANGGNASNYIEISWNSASNGSLGLYVNGTLQQTVNGNNSNYTLDSIRLGSVTPASNSGTTAEYFDAFVSTRGTVVIGQ